CRQNGLLNTGGASLKDVQKFIRSASNIPIKSLSSSSDIREKKTASRVGQNQILGPGSCKYERAGENHQTSTAAEPNPSFLPVGEPKEHG
ncbi:unnamed protein product, partial [Staurois parvus]